MRRGDYRNYYKGHMDIFKFYQGLGHTCRGSALTGMGWSMSISHSESFPGDTNVELGLRPMSLKLPSALSVMVSDYVFGVLQIC